MNRLAFALALLFLAGCLLLIAASFPAVRARYPKLMMWGSLLLLVPPILMFVAALALP